MLKMQSPHQKPQDQLNSCLHQGIIIDAPYLLFGSITPMFWPNPCCYSLLDYSRMHMQPYIIQYPSTYPNYGAAQRPIIVNNDLVRSKLINGKRGEKNKKQDKKCSQPW